jgi:hypothetical protein
MEATDRILVSNLPFNPLYYSFLTTLRHYMPRLWFHQGLISLFLQGKAPDELNAQGHSPERKIKQKELQKRRSQT